MAPRSLVDMCMRACVRHLNSLTSVGDCPFSLVREILEKITIPSQLMTVEENSCQIRGHTAELWQKMIRREFPEHRTKQYVPKSPHGWHRIYWRYKREHDAGIASAHETLRKGVTSLQREKEANVSRTLEGKVASRLRLPDRNVRKAATPSRPRPGASDSVLRKARREAMTMHGYRSNILTPSGVVPLRTSTVVTAPPALLNDRRIDRQPIFVGAAAKKAAALSTLSKPASSPSSDGVVPARKARDLADSRHRLPADRVDNPSQVNLLGANPSNENKVVEMLDQRSADQHKLPHTKSPAAPSTSLSPPTPDPTPRKRKAVDIFMRPRKRVS